LPVGTRVSVGIRPELLGVASEGIAACVTHIENLGSDLLIHASVETGDKEISAVARLNPYQTARPALGELIHLAPTEPRLLVFGGNGRRVPILPETAS